MSKALVVGIDHYIDSHNNLCGAVIDARNMYGLLSRNEDNSKNFECELLISDETHLLDKRTVRENIRALFAGKGETALLYFAGHGSIADTGGYICASDSLSADDGISVEDIMKFANGSKYHNRVVILDSCHSGTAGTTVGQSGIVGIAEGVTILTASTELQASGDTEQGGVFTNLLVDALEGSASNLLGEITPGAVYSHIDQSLGEFGQRPMFKTNVQNFITLRKVLPPLPAENLQRILEFFPSRNFYFALDPSFEPLRNDSEKADPAIPPPNPINTATFAILQQYARVGLLRPEGQPHMWHAAMYHAGARLTRLGEHYRSLRERDKL